jgi:hypothetical protein
MKHFSTKPPIVVSIRRNPLYDNPILRSRANTEVTSDAEAYFQYDKGGIAEYITRKFPSLRDSDKKFYCSELIGHYCLAHSYGQMTLNPDGHQDDDVSPYGIQIHRQLKTLSMPYNLIATVVRPMDYLLTTCLDLTGFFIAVRTAGLVKALRQRRFISTHAGVVVSLGGVLWIAEMLIDGGPVLSGWGKYFPASA